MENFETIIDLVQKYIKEDHQKNPTKKKGLKPSLMECYRQFSQVKIPSLIRKMSIKRLYKNQLNNND